MPLPSAFYAWGRGMLALDAGFAFLTLLLELFQDRCPHGPSLLLTRERLRNFVTVTTISSVLLAPNYSSLGNARWPCFRTCLFHVLIGAYGVISKTMHGTLLT